VYNYNAGIQRQLPQKLFLDVSYAGNLSRHLWLSQPLNTVPFGSAWQPYTQDPTQTPAYNGTTNLPANLYRPYPGYGPITDFTWGTSANFNALQVSLTRRVGRLQVGANYMWSKALGVGVGHPTNTRAFGYGPLTQDRAQSLSVNYIYDLPSPARPGSFLANPAAKLILNNWELAGLTSISTGAPVTPMYGVSGIGSTTLNQEITGSADVAPRVVLSCDPNLSRGSRGINEFINTSCFAPAQKGSIALDSGYNPVFGPGINQWDMSLYKNIPVKERFRAQLRLEAYNAFNHTEWGTVNTTALFNTAGQLINLPTQLGGTGGRFGFGTENSIRANSQRILQVGAKVYF
ncbi:MAG: hypothetical protein JOZ22_16745, partial [Acidobacteriia bacterium]|nr:hypothetical protein [Terriglobia bacterium]